MANPDLSRRDELKSRGDRRNSRTTVSGPSKSISSTSVPDGFAANAAGLDDLAAKAAGMQELARRMRFKANKPHEYDPAAAISPKAGQSLTSRHPVVTASTSPRRTRRRGWAVADPRSVTTRPSGRSTGCALTPPING